MKKLSKTLIAFFGLSPSFFVGGCATTTITEYDKEGNITKVTESDESAFAIIAQSTTDKDNFFHASGWAVGVQPSAGIYGVGAFDMIGGSIKSDNGAVNAASYATMVNASKVTLDLTADKNGITAKASSNEAKQNSNASATSETESEK